MNIEIFVCAGRPVKQFKYVQIVNLKAAGDIDQDQYDNTIAAYKLNQTTLAPALDYTFHFYTKRRGR